jgi:hypothetical protein
MNNNYNNNKLLVIELITIYNYFIGNNLMTYN